MLELRRSTAAVLLVGGAMVPALAAAPAYAVDSSSAAVLASAADWVYYDTYPNWASCDAEGRASGYQYQCVPCPCSSDAHDLYLFNP